jgi:hypothetical protein
VVNIVCSLRTMRNSLEPCVVPITWRRFVPPVRQAAVKPAP